MQRKKVGVDWLTLLLALAVIFTILAYWRTRDGWGLLLFIADSILAGIIARSLINYIKKVGPRIVAAVALAVLIVLSGAYLYPGPDKRVWVETHNDGSQREYEGRWAKPFAVLTALPVPRDYRVTFSLLNDKGMEEGSATFDLLPAYDLEVDARVLKAHYPNPDSVQKGLRESGLDMDVRDVYEEVFPNGDCFLARPFNTRFVDGKEPEVYNRLFEKVHEKLEESTSAFGLKIYQVSCPYDQVQERLN